MRRGSSSRYTKLLYVREVTTGRRLLARVALMVLGIATAVLVFWLERNSLRDANGGGGPMGFADVLYFTMVTVTTVGYGDIVPVGERRAAGRRARDHADPHLHLAHVHRDGI